MRVMLARKRVRANNFTAKRVYCVTNMFNYYVAQAQQWEQLQLVNAHNITLYITARFARMRILCMRKHMRNNSSMFAYTTYMQQAHNAVNLYNSTF